MITGPGFYPEMDADVYFSDPCPQPSLNQSGIPDLLDKSPLHFAYQHPRLNPYGQSSLSTMAQWFGSAVHRIALGRGREISPIRYRDFTTASAREARALAVANHKIPVLEKDLLVARDLAEILVKTIEHACDGEPYFTECACIWIEPTPFGDVWARAMFDVWCPSKGLILDPKVLSTPSIPGVFGQKAASMGYDLQARWYTRGAESVMPEMAGRIRFENLAIESWAPHGHALFHPDGESAATADLDINQAINLFGRCLASRSWPSYPKIAQAYSTPPYRQNRSLARAYAFDQADKI